MPDFCLSRGGTRQLLSLQLMLTSALFRSLYDNNLGKVGGTAVAKALETNTSLQTLK